jgi:hypothetical protein
VQLVQDEGHTAQHQLKEINEGYLPKGQEDRQLVLLLMFELLILESMLR